MTIRSAGQVFGIYKNGLLRKSIFLALIFAVGWAGAGWRANLTDVEMRQDLLRLTSGIARAVNPEQIKALSFTDEDRSRPAFQRLRKQMIDYGHLTGQHNIYSVAIRNNRLLFGPENLEINEPMASSPGRAYLQSQQELLDVFKNRLPVVVGPYSDEHGTFVSGFAPVVDYSSGEVLLVIGVNIPADQWKKQVESSRVLVIALTMSLLLILLAGLTLLQWRDRIDSQKTARGWLLHVETILTAFLGLGLSLILALGVHDIEKRMARHDFLQTAEEEGRIIGEAFKIVSRDTGTLASFMEIHTGNSYKEFESFVRSLVITSNVQAWEWVPIVSPDEKSNFETSLRSQISSIYQLYEKDANGLRIPVIKRERYTPVTYVMPLKGNEAALGFDLGSEAVRRTAIEEALK